MSDGLRHISRLFADYFAELNPSPNGKGPAAEPPALSTTGQKQHNQADDGTPCRYTFERFHEQTAYLTPSQRLAVFLSLPPAARAELWRNAGEAARQAR